MYWISRSERTKAEKWYVYMFISFFSSSLPLCMIPAGKWIYLLEMCYCCYVIVSFMYFFSVFFLLFLFLFHFFHSAALEICAILSLQPLLLVLLLLFFLLILYFHLIFIYLYVECVYVFCVYECVHNRCYLFLLTHSICKILYSFGCARFSFTRNIQTLTRARSRANRTASTSLNSHKFFCSIVFPALSYLNIVSMFVLACVRACERVSCIFFLALLLYLVFFLLLHHSTTFVWPKRSISMIF